MGFGRPLDYEPWIAIPGAIAGEWQGQIRMMAAALGVDVDEVRETSIAGTDRDLDVAIGRVEAGTCGALRMQAIGVVDGREAIVIEHVTRLAHDIAPDWPTGRGQSLLPGGHRGRAGYRLHDGSRHFVIAAVPESRGWPRARARWWRPRCAW